MTSHTLPKDKIASSRYAYASSLIEELRKNFSVKEVSRIAQGHSEMHGWADTALRLRGVVTEHHIKNMEEYLRPKKRRGITPGDSRLTPDQRKTYRKLVLRLREIHGWDNAKIAAALELHGKEQVSKILAEGAGTLSRLQKAQAITDTLDRAIAEAAAQAADQEPPWDTEEREKAERLREAFTKLTNGTREEAPEPVVATPTAPAPSSTPLANAVARGEDFLRALEALEASLPAFAKKAAREINEQARAVVALLTEG